MHPRDEPWGPRRPGGIWIISFRRIGIRNCIPFGAQYGEGLLSQERFPRGLREEFIARRLIKDIPLGVARFSLRARVSAKPFKGQTNTHAANISGRDFEILLQEWIARSEGPTILRDA